MNHSLQLYVSSYSIDSMIHSLWDKIDPSDDMITFPINTTVEQLGQTIPGFTKQYDPKSNVTVKFKVSKLYNLHILKQQEENYGQKISNFLYDCIAEVELWVEPSD